MSDPRLRAASTTYGAPGRPAIVLLHGIRLGRDIWVQHARALADEFFVVTPDLPGHGCLVDIPFTGETLSALLDVILDELVGAPALIVGYSLGGYAAMSYALAHPERTCGLVLAGCTLDFDGWKAWPGRVTGWMSRAIPAPLLRTAMRASLRATVGSLWAETIEPIPFSIDVLMQMQGLAFAARRPSAAMHAYAKPVLYLNGANDLIFRIDEGRFMRDTPRAELRLIDGVDHTAPLRRAGTFTDLVRAFAQRTAS
ncbi:MAG: alpha/beta fold hydrolase [Vulcanimicrobiaceae bacterium]